MTLQGGILKVKEYLRPRPDGTPKLRILRDAAPHLVSAIGRYQWKVVNGVTTDKPLARNVDSCDCLGYLVMHPGIRFHHYEGKTKEKKTPLNSLKNFATRSEEAKKEGGISLDSRLTQNGSAGSDRWRASTWRSCGSDAGAVGTHRQSAQMTIMLAICDLRDFLDTRILVSSDRSRWTMSWTCSTSAAPPLAFPGQHVHQPPDSILILIFCRLDQRAANRHVHEQAGRHRRRIRLGTNEIHHRPTNRIRSISPIVNESNRIRRRRPTKKLAPWRPVRSAPPGYHHRGTDPQSHEYDRCQNMIRPLVEFVGHAIRALHAPDRCRAAVAAHPNAVSLKGALPL